MNITKTLLLASFTALTLGGAAMAQESAGGYIAGPFDQQNSAKPAHAARGAFNLNQAPQYGAADHAVSNWPVLEGGDGN